MSNDGTQNRPDKWFPYKCKHGKLCRTAEPERRRTNELSAHNDIKRADNGSELPQAHATHYEQRFGA